MPEPNETAEPGTAPGVPRTAGTMFAALYGELVPHSWRDVESEHDAYQLFMQRSLAMGWLDDRATGGDASIGTSPAPGLWSLNDAGWKHPLADPAAGLVSWFQVDTSAVVHDRPLPTQPFLRCAADVTACVGTLRLFAVQVLLPVQGIEMSSRPAFARAPSIGTVDWFHERDPSSRTPMAVSVDSGANAALAKKTTEIIDSICHTDQEFFRCQSSSTGGPLALEPLFGDLPWNGPAAHRLTMEGELVEWSAEALGWFAALIADLCALHGVSTPLVVTMVRRAALQ